MKKLTILIAIGVNAVIPAYAGCINVGIYTRCYTWVDCDEYADKITLTDIDGCSTYDTPLCYEIYSYQTASPTQGMSTEYHGVKTCETCKSNWNKISGQFPTNTPSVLAIIQKTVYTCQWQGCDSCPTWQDYKIGYQRKYTCNETSRTCAAASIAPLYRCATGYYKSGNTINCTISSGTGPMAGQTICRGCSQCPEATDIWTDANLTTLARGTSEPGSTSQSACYLSGIFYDATGKFTIDDTNCTYQ